MKTYDETTKSILQKIDREEKLLQSQRRVRKTPKIVYVAALLIVCFAGFNLIKDANNHMYKAAEVDNGSSSLDGEKSIANFNINSNAFTHNDINYTLNVIENIDESFEIEPQISEDGIIFIFNIDDTYYELSSDSDNLDDFNEVLNSLK